MAPDVQCIRSMRRFACALGATFVLFGCDLVADSKDPKPEDFELESVTTTTDPLADGGLADEGG